MARTKQTARRSTGPFAPRKQRARDVDNLDTSGTPDTREFESLDLAGRKEEDENDAEFEDDEEKDEAEMERGSDSKEAEPAAQAAPEQKEEEQPENPIDPSLLDAYTNAKAMGDNDMVEALEAALSDSYGAEWKVLAGLEKKAPAPKHVVRDQTSRIFDFRTGKFPEGASLVGAQGVFEAQRDGSTCLVVPPISHLLLDELRLTPVNGQKVNDFTITMDILLEHLPSESLALFQTCSAEGRITEGEAFLYRNGGVGVFGEVGVENAVVRPNKWSRVVITLGPSPYNPSERVMTTYVNGVKCASISSFKRGVIGTNDGRFSLNPDRLLLFASSQEESMPGCRIKYCEIECRHKTEEEVKQDSYKNRIFSTYDAERMAELEKLYAALTLQPLYKRPPPVWMHPCVLAEFGDAFLENTGLEGGNHATTAAVYYMTMQRMLGECGPMYLDGFDHSAKQAMNALCQCMQDFKELARKFALVENSSQLVGFIKRFKRRLESLKEGEYVLVPSTINGQMLLFIVEYEAADQFRFSVVNTSPTRGLDWHLATAETAPKIKYKTVLSVCNVRRAKMMDDAFWSMLFKLSVYGTAKRGAFDELYDWLLPFLVDKPLEAILGDMQDDPAISYRSPERSNTGYMRGLIEASTYLLRRQGLTVNETKMFAFAMRAQMLEFVRHDLQFVNRLTDSDKKVLRMICEQVAYASVKLAKKGLLTASQLETVHSNVEEVNRQSANKRLHTISSSHIRQKIDLEDGRASRIEDIHHPFFDRLLRTEDVDGLAGAPIVNPKYVPIDTLLIPKCVENFEDALAALRYCDKLCTLISVQPHCVKNRNHLKVSLIEHTFTKIVPVPKSPIAEDYDRCIWRTPLRYAVQLDVMILLQRIIEHFVAAVFALHSTKALDALKLVIPACIAAIADVVMRKEATDIPSELCMHLQAAPGRQGFGLSIGHFDSQSETIEVHYPELHIARTAVLDYFSTQHSLTKIFCWENGNQPEDTLAEFFAGLCAEVAFPPNPIAYLAQTNALVMKNYPEFRCYRDIAFYFKFFQNTDIRKFPQKADYEQIHAELNFQFQMGQFMIQGMGMYLQCYPEPPLTFTHRYPSMTSPSHLTDPHIVRTEDDVLHIKNLPSFEDAIGQQDSELLISYLTVPYIRVPLVLTFFSTEDRIHSLKSKELQAVLDGVLFEPGRYLSHDMNTEPREVPARDQRLLATSYGHLVNELHRSPEVVVNSVVRLIQLALDLDTGTVHSTTVPIILYVIRMAARVHNYIKFLIDYATNKHDSIRIALRDVVVFPEVLEVLQQADTKIAEYFCGPLHRMLEAWNAEAMKECENVTDDQVLDENSRLACNLHAHLLLLYRSFREEELNIDIVQTILAAQVFLTTRHTWNLDLLPVPENEMFEILCVLRRRVISWLRQRTQQELNAVMEAVVRVAAGTGVRKPTNNNSAQDFNRLWAFVRGDRSVGRFTVATVRRQGTGDGSERAVQEVDPSLEFGIEIDVQIMQLTLKSSHLQALDTQIAGNVDVQTIFGSKSMQASEVQSTEHRQWVHLIGRNHDIQYWRTPDPRPCYQELDRDYVPGELEDSEGWIVPILEPVRMAYLVKPFVLQICLPERPLPADADVAYLVGIHPKLGGTWKEIFVFRTLRMVQIYNVYSHGRRFYRTLEYSTDARFTLRDMQPSIDDRMSPWPEWGRYEVGHPYAAWKDPTSCVITRSWDCAENLSGGVETFIPQRLLWGVVPHALLETYLFWQDEADNVRGYPADKKNPYIITVQLQNVGKIEATQLPGTNAVIKRTLRTSHEERMKVLSAMFVHVDECRLITGEWAPNFAFFQGLETFRATGFDAAAFGAAIAELKAQGRTFESSDDLLQAVREFPAPVQAEPSSAVTRYKTLDEEELILIDLLYARKGSKLFSLAQTLTRIEMLSYILAWTKDATYDPTNGREPLSLDFVELPRVKLSFHGRKDEHGVTRLYSMDHSHLFVSNYESKLTEQLMAGIPHSLLMATSNNELQILVPAINPFRPQIASAPFSTELVLARDDPEWYAKLDTNYFLYPVHVSLSFLFSPTLSSALYLLLLRLLHRDYEAVFRLANSIGTDTELSPEEAMIFEALSRCNGDANPDAHACRLKVNLVIIDSPVTAPWDLTIQMSRYITKLSHVSAVCRLTHEEELQLLSRCICDVSDPRFDPRFYTVYDITLVKNRKHYLLAAKQGLQEAPVFIVPPLRGTAWILERNQTALEANESAWNILTVQYAAPMQMTGTALLDETHKVWRGEDMKGQYANFGFLFLYELLTGTKKAKMLKDDCSISLALLLFQKYVDKDSFMGSILSMLMFNPHLCADAPRFKDTRQFKNTAINAFPDDNEPVSPLADLFTRVLPYLMEHIDEFKEPADSSLFIPIVPPPETCPVVPEGPRDWVLPTITNFGCSERQLDVVTPQQLPDLALSHDELAFLCSSPLDVISIGSYVAMIKRSDLALPAVDHRLPFDVTDHSQAKSAVAVSMIERLQNDMVYFAEETNKGDIPKMICLLDEVVRNNLVQVVNGTVQTTEALSAAMATLTDLVQKLEALREQDAAYVDRSLPWMEEFANAVELHNAQHQPDMERLIFALRRFSKQEVTLWTEFMFGSVLSSEQMADMQRLNPYLGEDKIKLLTSVMVGCIFHANRVGHINRCVSDARDVIKLLQKVGQPGTTVVDSGKARLTAEHEASIILKGESLARQLTMNRYFVSSAEQQAVAKATAPSDHIDITAVAAAARAQQALVYDPRFLLFEFTWNILLRESQVILIREFMDALANGRSLVKQMIMGAGKTTVVGPLLTLILGDGRSLVMQVVPPALLEFSRSVMRSTFSSIMHKRIYTLNFDRAAEPDPNMYRKLQNAIRTMGVVISTPTAVKSVMLKYIELLDMIRDPTRPRHPDMERDAFELNRVLQLFNDGVLIMDEVDLILHPMKSELNFPIGAKYDLDFSPQRWQLPIHILDAIFYAERRRMSVNFKQSTRAKVILEKLDAIIQEGYRTRALQRNPHIVLLNPDWYHEVMKPIIADWTYLWLEAQHMANIRESEVKQYILEGAHQLKNPELAIRVNEQLSDTHKKMINLAHDWLRSYLPHVLQKIDRVSFGIMNKEDYERAVKADPNMPRTRAKLAIPFVGKDVPSRSSEFAHPDVIIGLSILAYRYEGLRWTDFEDIISNLRATLTKEMGPWNKRKSALRYARWVKEAGGRIKGQARYQDETSEQRALMGEAPMDIAEIIAGEEKAGDQEEETYDDALEVVPLRLLKRSNQDQMEKLFNIVRLLPDAIHWYLENFIFPSYMRHQVMKLSACGQEVGGDMLFTRRIGFSGTPSDLLPVELGRCGYEKGSDGQMIHVMTSPDIVSFEIVPEGWSVKSLLDRIAQAQSPQFNALIDTGALITGLTNYQVAKYLLDNGLPWCEGVVFLDEYDRKMILVRATGRVVKMAQSGIPANKRFAFYDQVHTTGMDIQHMLNAKAVLTLGKDMTFRDYAQGAFRMRGIAKGQTIHLFIIPEVYQLMQRELSSSKTSGEGVALLQAAMPMEDSPAPSATITAESTAAVPPGHFVSFHLPTDAVKRVLVDVVAWLVVNSMRSERVQFNQLCLQNIANVWRKPAFKTVLHGLQEFKVTVDPSGISPHAMQSLDVFCESIDFSLEAGVPEPVLFAESIRRRVETHIQFITFEEQRKIIDDIVKTVSGSFLDETDRVLSAEMVQEQEEEKEKQQEQEQEQEIEIEKYVDLAYSRENEEPVPWEFATLSLAEPSQFYKLEEFKLYKRRPLQFPEYVGVSNNYFDKRWSGARRVKNVVMVLDWTWDASDTGMHSHSLEPLSEDQERTLATAIELFDQNNSGQFDLHALELVLKSAAHLKLDEAQLQAFMHEATGSASTVLSYDQIRQVLVSGRFDQYQRGRRFVALSLAEAETIRRIMHMRLGSPIIDGTKTTMALRCLPAGFVVTDRSSSFTEAPSDYMTKAAQQSLRFFNCEMFLSEENLNVLLRALHKTTRRERLNFFRNIIGCRRRMARKWEETPLAKVFALADQFGMLKQRAQSVRVREGIKQLGLLLYDAFNKFDYDKNGLLSPAEVWGAFDFLGMHSMTAHDVVDFVRTADTDRDGNISYKEFIEILQDPEAVEKGEDAELDDEEVAMFTPAMQRQVSLSPVEPRGQEELEAVQAQIILDEQREDELAQQREQEEEARIQAEMEMEEDERDRAQEGGRNPKISGDMIRYDFSTGRRPRRISTRGDIAFRPDESANKQFLKVFAPCVLFLDVPFGGNCGGTRLNQYTVTMEVMFEEFPQPGEQAALFSTAKHNESTALVYLASNGTIGRGVYFGDPETTSSMQPNRWHYITLVGDCIGGTLTTYIDGQRCSEIPMVEGNTDEYQATAFDGPFSCGDTVCLFASKEAASCRGGNLRQVVVATHCLQGSEIFEVIQNLKQEMEGDVLTHIVTSLIGMGVDEEVAAWAAQNSTGSTIEERVTNALNAVYSGQF